MQRPAGNNAPWMYDDVGISGAPSLWKSVTADGTQKIVVTLPTASNPNWFIHNGHGQI